MRSRFDIRKFNPILAFLMCFKTLSKMFPKRPTLVVSTSLSRGQVLEKVQTFTLIWSTKFSQKTKYLTAMAFGMKKNSICASKLVEIWARQSTYKGSSILCVLSSDQVSSSTTHHSCSHTLLYHTHLQIGSLGHSTSTSHGNHHPTPEGQLHNCICAHVGHPA